MATAAGRVRGEAEHRQHLAAEPVSSSAISTITATGNVFAAQGWGSFWSGARRSFSWPQLVPTTAESLAVSSPRM